MIHTTGSSAGANIAVIAPAEAGGRAGWYPSSIDAWRLMRVVFRGVLDAPEHRSVPSEIRCCPSSQASRPSPIDEACRWRDEYSIDMRIRTLLGPPLTREIAYQAALVVAVSDFVVSERLLLGANFDADMPCECRAAGVSE